MAKKQRDRKSRSPHRTATRRPRRERAVSAKHPDALQGAFFGGLREALRSRDPIDFWGAATSIVVLVDDPGDLEDALPEGVDLLQTFIDVDVAETTALLHMVAAMSQDELKRARARRAVQGRRQPVPPHVSGLADLAVTGTRVFSDFAGDNYLLELTLPGEVRVSLVAYVERAPRLYLKDAFFVAQPLDTTQERFVSLMAADGVPTEGAVRDLDPAQSRAGLERALRGADSGPVKEPEEGDQWPMCRPLVEFALARLPEGGAGYDARGFLVGQQGSDLLLREREDGEDAWLGDGAFLAETAKLVEEFVASPHARELPQDASTQLLATVLMTMAIAAEGDPLHWCPNVLRWVLEEALPRSPLLTGEAMDEVRQVFPALVAWAHEESEEDAETVQDALALMPTLLADLPRRWASKEMQVARLEIETDLALLTDDLVTIELALLAQQVGGDEALQDLSTDPLPDEPLLLDAVPEDLHGQLMEIDAAVVAGLADVHADQLPRPQPELDVEFLTAVRRFLVQAAVGDPDVLRGRANVVSTAVAAALVVGRGNGLIGRGTPVRTSELVRAFGVRNAPSQRARRLQEAAMLPRAPEGEMLTLGSPDLLVASARSVILADYERWAAAAADDDTPNGRGAALLE